MMRRLAILGLLLLPSFASAQTTLPPAISPFVQGVLDRTDAVLQLSVPALPATDDCTQVIENAIEQSLNETRKIFDAQVSIVEESKSLREHTICLRYDLLLLEKKMTQLREQMMIAADQCTPVAALKTLADLHTFVYEAYASVLEGGTNPRYTDFRLRQDLQFLSQDDIVRKGFEDMTACPFTSDYGPPTAAYGCSEEVIDLTIMRADDSIIPPEMKSEAEQTMETLRSLEGFGGTLRAQIDTFEREFLRILSRIRGTPAPAGSPVSATLPTDRQEPITGCKEEIVTDDNGDRMVFAAETWDPDELPAGMLLRSSRDSLWLAKNPVMTLQQFITYQFERGAARPLPSVSPAVTFLGLIEQIAGGTRQRLQSAIFGREEAAITASSTDALERVYETVSPLRQAVRSFGTLSSFPVEGAKIKKNGREYEEPLPLLRGYTRDLALFLRRSCVFGFCNDKLDAILKRTTNNSCFPYGTLCFIENPEYVEDCYEDVANQC